MPLIIWHVHKLLRHTCKWEQLLQTLDQLDASYSGGQIYLPPGLKSEHRHQISRVEKLKVEIFINVRHTCTQITTPPTGPFLQTSQLLTVFRSDLVPLLCS